MPYISAEKLRSTVAERVLTLNIKEVQQKFCKNQNIDNILEIADQGHFGVYIRNSGFVRLSTGYPAKKTPTQILKGTPYLVRLQNVKDIPTIVDSYHDKEENITETVTLFDPDKSNNLNSSIRTLIDKGKIEINKNSSSPALWFALTPEEKEAGITLWLHNNAALTISNPFRITKEDLLFIESEIKIYRLSDKKAWMFSSNMPNLKKLSRLVQRSFPENRKNASTILTECQFNFQKVIEQLNKLEKTKKVGNTKDIYYAAIKVVVGELSKLKEVSLNKKEIPVLPGKIIDFKEFCRKLNKNVFPTGEGNFYDHCRGKRIPNSRVLCNWNGKSLEAKEKSQKFWENLSNNMEHPN